MTEFKTLINRADAWIKQFPLGEDTKLIRDLRDALQRQGWRTIDSAPKDGTAILVSAHRATPISVRWMVSPSKGTGWYVGGYDGLLINTWKPTHWQPLPTPPTTEENNNGN